MKNVITFINMLKIIRFDNLRKSRVLVFDRANSDFLKKCLLRDLDHTILDTRKEIYYLSPNIIFLMIKNILRPKFMSLLWTLKPFGLVLLTYLYSCIEYINPKVVVTFSDTDFHFQWISRTYKRAKFYAIQNGVRTKYEVCMKLPPLPHPAHIISMPDFICFGTYERSLYSSHGHMIDRFHPVGSLLGGYYKNEISGNAIEKEYDICLLSEWEILTLTTDYYCEAKRGLALLYDYFLRYLNEYSEKDSLRVCVATRTGEEGECEYFKKMYGNKVKLIIHDRERFTSYRAMDTSDVTIAFVTTAMREALGWGNKILACNFSNDYNYDFPVHGIWSIERSHYDTFRDRLNYLRRIDKNAFMAASAQARLSLMNYTEYRPAYKYIRNLISEGLR